MTQSEKNTYRVAAIGKMMVFAYLFFLSIALMGQGMKASFKGAVKALLHDHGGSFTELTSFVIGVVGTSLVQSSSTVTSMAVTLTQEEILPLVMAIGIVHGANLGTSVTSSLVAFFAETRPSTGNPLKDLWAMLTLPRLPGFHVAVSTAIVHGLFNAVLVTGILVVFELPFHLIQTASERSAHAVGNLLGNSAPLMTVLDIIKPDNLTKPVAQGLLALGVPGVVLVILGFAALFFSLRGFSSTMRGVLLVDSDPDDLQSLGDKLLGTTPLDTFLRGLILTILVQSSSATTSMVVPLAAMGFFNIRRIFPFILGANIGTTTTALLAAASAVGSPSFENGLTIALAHFYLNTLAVVLVVVIPGLQTSVLGCTEWLADAAVKLPAVLIGYLLTLMAGFPLVVYLLPESGAKVLIGGILVALLCMPHLYLRRKVESGLAVATLEG